MDTLDPTFVGVLRCPVTRVSLRLVSADLLRILVAAPLSCVLKQKTAGWDGGLLREDGRGLYPVRGGIPILLSEELVEVPEGLAVVWLAAVR